MAKTKAVPDSPEGIQELLNTPAAREIFNPNALANGAATQFINQYGMNFLKSNPEMQAQIREQAQVAIADMSRKAGVEGGPKLGVSMQGGKPVLTKDGITSVSRGRGGVYNHASVGAALERKYQPKDRFESIGEYYNAIFDLKTRATRQGAADRIEKLTRIQEFQNSFSSEEPGAGGFLIPELMRSEIMQFALEDSVVRSRATVIPMSTLRVPVPTVDDTSHTSSVFGGVTANWTEEAAQLTESTATFGRVVLDAKKLTAFFKTPRELLQDAPAFAGWFDTWVPKAIAWFEDVAFISGDDAGQPLGFLSCPASISVPAQSGQTATTLQWENLVAMYSRMMPSSLKNAVWIANNDTFPELATMALSVGTGGGPVWIGGWSQPGSEMPPITILGRPVIFTEKVSSLGTSGDISFVDLSYYLIGDRQEIRVDSSDQYLFQNDQIAFRAIERVDGRPWIQQALTPHSGSSNTLSPFVQLATRS